MKKEKKKKNVSEAADSTGASHWIKIPNGRNKLSIQRQPASPRLALKNMEQGTGTSAAAIRSSTLLAP